MAQERPPRIVVTHAAVAHEPADSLNQRKVRWYLAAAERAGGEAVGLAPDMPAAERARILASMEGLMISGGADIDPARYGEEVAGAEGMDPARDALEAEAFAVAEARGLPVLGICRGLQALNVFSGGRLIQHVDGHEGPPPGSGPATVHPLVLSPGSRLAGILGVPEGATLPVNSYHHQGVTPDRLAPGLLPTGTSPYPGGTLIEAFERPGPRFFVAVQCHPERTDSTPDAFARLFRAFVAAAAERTGR